MIVSKPNIGRAFPRVLDAPKDVNARYAPPLKGKGYSLSKVANKKYGFLYYVRYLENGRLITSRWNTRTKNLDAAERFARENRERLLAKYHVEHDGSKQFFQSLSDFYVKGSEYMTVSANRGRVISETTRVAHHTFMLKTLIPYFKKHNINNYADVTKPALEKFQDSLLALGLKPQSVGRYLSGARQMFDYFVSHGTIQANPFRGIVRIKPRKNDVKIRGCYEIDTLKGVFNKEWRNDINYMLCLIIYTTDMRNSEIERIQVRDIIEVDTLRCFDIDESKTENGTRIIPLHPFVYTKLQEHIARNNLGLDDRLFNPNNGTYRRANAEMGRLMGKTPEELSALNITFYSGRRFWKTAMNVEGLGAIEEYFMGHKVSADVAKLYNHKDKVGRKNIVAKAGAMFAVLDKYLGLDK